MAFNKSLDAPSSTGLTAPRTTMQRRLMMRLGPIVMLIFVLIGVFLFLFIRESDQFNLIRNQQTETLALSDSVNAVVDRLGQSTRQLAGATPIRQFAALLNSNPNQSSISTLQTNVLREFRTALELNPDAFLSIRYVTINGSVWSQSTFLENGNIQETFAIQSGAFAGDATLRRILSAQFGDVVISDVSLLNPANPLSTPYIRFASPIAPLNAQGNIVAAILIDVRAEYLIEQIRQSFGIVTSSITDRQLLIVDTADRIIFDNQSLAQNELRSLFGEEPITLSGKYPTVADDMRSGLIATEGRNWLSSLDIGSNIVSSGDILVPTTQQPYWYLILVDTLTIAAATSNIVSIFAFIGSVIAGLIVCGMFYVLLGRMLNPIRRANQLADLIIKNDDTAEKIMATTDLSSFTTRPSSQDDLGVLIDAFQTLRTRTELIRREGDVQISRYSRNLDIAARIGRETATLYDLDVLLTRAIDLICKEYGYYHAQVFLVDDVGKNAYLSHSYGEVGEQLLAQDHRLTVGSASVIGQVTARGQYILVNDTLAEGSTHRFNPLLPDTRAELAVPLNYGSNTLGALDIQSLEPNIFQEEEIHVFQLLADQIAAAVQNARLLEEAQERVRQIDALNRQLTRVSWSESTAQTSEPVQMTYNLKDLRRETSEQIQIDTDETIKHDAISIPITIRGEVVGTIDAEMDAASEFSQNDATLLRTVADRVANAIESVRLYEETQINLNETSVLYQLNHYLNEADTLEEILEAIAASVVTDAVSGQIAVFDDYLESPEWLEITADWSLSTDDRTRNVDLLGLQLELSKHPILQSMSIDSVTLIEDVMTDPRMDTVLMAILEQSGARSLLLLPINVREVWRGVIMLEFDQPRTFDEREVNLYRSAINHVGVAIENRMLLRQNANTLAQVERLYTASRLINMAQTPEDLLRALNNSTDKNFHYALALLVENADNEVVGLRMLAYTEDAEIHQDDQYYDFDLPKESPLRDRKPLVVYDHRDVNMQLVVQFIRERGFPFSVLFGLYSANRPFALFCLFASEVQDLSEDDYDTFIALTGQMSTALQNSRLLQQTEAALSETRRLYEATRSIVSANEPKAVAYIATQYMRTPKVTRIDYLRVNTTPSFPTRNLVYDYVWLQDDQTRSEIREGRNVPTELLHLRALLGEQGDTTRVIQDVSTDLTEQQSLATILQRTQTESALMIPIFTRQRWFGLFIIHSNEINSFEESHVRFAEAVTSQVATALETFALYETTESERRTLSSILSTLPAGVLVLDPHTLKPVQSNAQIEALLGRPINVEAPFSTDLYNLYRADTQQIYPEQDSPLTMAAQSITQVVRDDVTVRYDDGTEVSLLVNAAPILDASNRPTAIVAAFQDITSLRMLEASLQENLFETITMYEASRALSNAANLEEILQIVTDQAQAVHPTGVQVLLLDETYSEVSVVASTGEFKNNHSLPANVLDPTNSIFWTDVATGYGIDESLRKQLLQAGIEAIATIPFLTGSRREVPLGWMVIWYDKPHPELTSDQQLLSTLADNVAVAIDNRNLFLSTENALKDTAELYDATTNISRISNEPELANALRSAFNTLGADYFAILTVRDDHIDEILNVGMDGQALSLAKAAAEAQIQYGFATRFVEDLQALPSPDLFERNLIDFGTVKSYAALAMMTGGRIIGALFVGYHEKRQFTQSQARYLSAIADSTSAVLANLLLFEQIQTNLQETNTLYEISQDLTQVTSPSDLAAIVQKHLVPSVDSVAVLGQLDIQHWEQRGTFLTISDLGKHGTEFDNLQDIQLSANNFPLWPLLAAREIVTVDDVQTTSQLDEATRNALSTMNIRSFALIPLRVGTRDIGALMIVSSSAVTFNQRNIRLYTTFIEQASLRLDAVRLNTQIERRARQLATSAEVSQIASSILDINQLLPQVVELVKESFGYDHVQVFLMDEEDRYAVLNASTGDAGKQLLAIRHKLEKGSQSVIGQVTKVGEPVIALDTLDARFVHRPNPYLPRTRSEMAIPLILKDQIVGALDVQSNHPNAFDNEDVSVLTTLAAQISVALDNAQLFEDSRQRANEMSFLFSVTTAAASGTSLNEALNNVTFELQESFDASATTIYLPETFTDLADVTHSRLAPVAMSGAQQPMSEMSEIPLYESSDENPNLIAEAAEMLKPAIITHIERETNYVPIGFNSKSAIIVPLSSGSTLLGVVVLESADTEAFDNNSLTLLMTLSGTLAAIIQSQSLLEQLQATNEQLRELDRLKSDFLANMSHELRTPLNSIIGFSRVILKGIDGPLTEMQEQDLSTIYNSGMHLLNLINDILDQAKIAAGKMDLQLDFFDMKSVIDTVRSMGIGLVKDKPIDIYVDIAPSLPEVYGDEFRSRQVLINLISNAAKFTKEGSITIHVYPTKNDHGQHMIRTDVVDTGIGISENDISLLFEAFRQIDSSLTRTVGGTGLGLPIAKSLIEMMGGEMFVQSQVNVGSTFSILLPTQPSVTEETDGDENGENEKLSTREQPMIAADAPTPHTNGSASTNEDTAVFRRPRPEADEAPRPVYIKRQILIIEDNPEMVDQYRRALGREGYEIFAASIPLEAEAMASGLHPTIILMDVNFSNGQGWDILARLKAREDTLDIPVIVTSLSTEVERIQEMGAFRYLARPFSPEQLLDMVHAAEQESRVARILIIDDQPESSRLIGQLLELQGKYRVITAHSGAEGISLVARRRPHLIILDVRMPEMDGFAVIQELKSNPETASIPVLVITGETLTAEELEQLRLIEIISKQELSSGNTLPLMDGIRTYLSRYSSN